MRLFLPIREIICLLAFNHLIAFVCSSSSNEAISSQKDYNLIHSEEQELKHNQFKSEIKFEDDVTFPTTITPTTIIPTTTSAPTTTTTATEYCPNQCDCLHFDETIDCSHRRLDTLPLFNSHAKRLYLEDNRITFLPPNSFSTAPELLLIVLERNELSFVDSGSFCNLIKLQELDLGGNRVQNFVVDSSHTPTQNTSINCVSSHLKEINLSLNLLTKLPENLSDFAPNLEILNLSYNEIETIKADDSYEKFKCLKHLDLSRNKIHWIEKNDLKALRPTPLEILNLAESGVGRIDGGSFEGLNNLTSLSLANNIIDFENLELVLNTLLNKNRSNNAIKRLDVSEINLPNITIEMLGHLRGLIILDASLCDVENVQPEIFDYLEKLETLHLEFGKLKSLKNLAAAKDLRRIYLQDNQLTELNMTGLYKLETVDLSYNQIEKISELWMEGLKNLQVLNLSHNHIHTVESNSFKESSIMLTLDFSYNNLINMHSMGLEKLTKIDLSHNSISTFDQNILKHLHESLTDIDFSYNNLSQFSYSLFEPIHNLQALNLAGNKLGPYFSSFSTKENESPFSSLAILKYLDISENHIYLLDCKLISPLRNLLTLNLRQNEISKISDINLNCVESLVKLVLSNNKMVNVDVEVLETLVNLEEMDVSSNPFECNCAILDFLRWANTTQVRIIKEVEDDSYRCHSVGRAVDDSTANEDAYLLGINSWTSDDFLFLYRPEYDRCYNKYKQSVGPHYDQIYMSSFDNNNNNNNNPQQQAQRNDDATKNNTHNYLAAKYFSVFCVTTFAGVLVGMTVIFVAWRFRNCIYQLTLFNSRWRVRYREVSDLESALDSRV